MNRNVLRIGTRSSELALWQTNHVRDLLLARDPALAVEIVPIKTLGDKILDSPLAKIGDKGLFTKELENALLDGRVDLAVHSLKDVPTAIPDGLTLAAFLEREDVRDVFIAHPRTSYQRFADLPNGATIATGSLRRKCQILAARPDLTIVDIRGNLNTRMLKLEGSTWDGMLLARAGVVRLGWSARITDTLPFELMLPAVGQGALAIETRVDDRTTRSCVSQLAHLPTSIAVLAERALLRRLEGGCQIPIGAYARVEDSEVILDGVIGSLDGRTIIRGKRSGSSKDPETVGKSLAEELISRGGGEILDAIRRTS